MAGRKTFQAGEVLQAADVNDFLMDQSVMVFAGTAARGSAIPSPTEGMVTYREDDDTVEVFDGSAFVPVGASPAILQVVSTTKTDTASTASTSFSDITGLTASITPSSATNKILVVFSGNFATNATVSTVYVQLARNGSAIAIGDAASSRPRTTFELFSSSTAQFIIGSMNFLDSPASTSAISYSVQWRSQSGDHVAYLNRTFDDTDGVNARARTVSTITLMEIAG